MKTKIVINKHAVADAAKDFIETWKRAEQGEQVEAERIIAFESYEAMTAVLTPERTKLLRHLHAHPARSVRALSLALDRDYKRVHTDVTALEEAGLIERDEDGVRATVDKMQVEIDFAA